MNSLGNKFINNSNLGLYRIYKVLEQLNKVQYSEIKNQNKSEITKYIYKLYNNLKKELQAQNDQELEQKIQEQQDIPENIKNIVQSYFDSSLGLERDLQDGDLLDSVFIQTICEGFEHKSHLSYKFGGVLTYQDFENKDSNLGAKYIIKTLLQNLQEININKEEYDIRLKKMGLDDKVDYIQKLKQCFKKYSEIGFVLNTCHYYSPGQHWVSIGFKLGETPNGKKLFQINYYDSQMTDEQRQNIGIQTEMLNCDTLPNCPEQYKNYIPHIKEWFNDLVAECEQQNIKYEGQQEYGINVNFNKRNTQNDDYSCGYHAILFNYLFAINGEVLDSIQNKVKQSDTLDNIISQFRQLLLRQPQNKKPKIKKLYI